MDINFLLYLATALFVRPALAMALDSFSSGPFRFDVHSHVAPDFYHEALGQGGFPVINGTVYVNNLPVPSWRLDTHIQDMDANQVNYSSLSISAPGVNFLAGNKTAASQLARSLNLAMHNYTQQYPTRLGAMCILPLPHIDAAVEEIKVSQISPERIWNLQGNVKPMNRNRLTLKTSSA